MARENVSETLESRGANPHDGRRLLDYSTGKGSPEDRLDTEQHVIECQDCFAKVIKAKGLRSKLGELDKQEIRPSGKCPSSWEMASVLHGLEDISQPNEIRKHMLNCVRCLHEASLDSEMSQDGGVEAHYAA